MCWPFSELRLEEPEKGLKPLPTRISTRRKHKGKRKSSHAIARLPDSMKHGDSAAFVIFFTIFFLQSQHKQLHNLNYNSHPPIFRAIIGANDKMKERRTKTEDGHQSFSNEPEVYTYVPRYSNAHQSSVISPVTTAPGQWQYARMGDAVGCYKTAPMPNYNAPPPYTYPAYGHYNHYGHGYHSYYPQQYTYVPAPIQYAPEPYPYSTYSPAYGHAHQYQMTYNQPGYYQYPLTYLAPAAEIKEKSQVAAEKTKEKTKGKVEKKAKPVTHEYDYYSYSSYDEEEYDDDYSAPSSKPKATKTKTKAKVKITGKSTDKSSSKHSDHSSDGRGKRLDDGTLPWYGRTRDEIQHDEWRMRESLCKDDFKKGIEPTGGPSDMYYVVHVHGGTRAYPLGTIRANFDGEWKLDQNGYPYLQEK